ncbi:MAG: type IV pilus twitching motility protein PilT [Tissierellia bacterium]|nr:type IV pilus twitching motility protein PilT [Tissierellia bacterium]MDD4726821.1 type IV pilus twitching motility protein PilT [Tissierellia bacterium]
MNLVEILNLGVEKKASDIHIAVGVPPTYRIYGKLVSFSEKRLTPTDTLQLTKEALNEDQFKTIEKQGELDFSYSILGIGRFRVNAYRQRNNYGLALRIIPMEIPNLESLGLPEVARDIAKLSRGLVLVTGPTGSGKSTTIASIIDLINRERNCHILTLEDPIEYLHEHKKSIVNQREIGNDSLSFANALRSALREDPDVILVGEMRDLETISITITAAETGHLVLSTLHTLGSVKSIDRIIDVFPPHQQQQIKVQLASVLKAVVSQQLLPKVDSGGRIAAFEVMIATPAIRNLIREGKIHQIDSMIQTGLKDKMVTMDNSIIDLFIRGCISKDVALGQAFNQQEIKKYLR